MNEYIEAVDKLLDNLTIPGFLQEHQPEILEQISAWQKLSLFNSKITSNYLEKAHYFASLGESHHLICCLNLAWSYLGE